MVTSGAFLLTVMGCYYLYILYSGKIDRYYVGISRDPEARLRSHNLYPRGWTKRGTPWQSVSQKPFGDRATAQRWERYLRRRKSRKLLEKVARGEFVWRKERVAVIPPGRDGGLRAIGEAACSRKLSVGRSVSECFPGASIPW